MAGAYPRERPRPRVGGASNRCEIGTARVLRLRRGVLGLVLLGLGRGGDALAEGVGLVLVGAVLGLERGGVVLALGLARLRGIDVGLDLGGDGLVRLRLGLGAHALAVGVGAVLDRAVLRRA